MAYKQGMSARRFSVIYENDQEISLPHCVQCDIMIREVNVPHLAFYKETDKYLQKYPWFEVTFVCDPCRIERGKGAKQYMVFEWDDDASLQDTLIKFLKNQITRKFRSPINGKS